MSKEKAFCTALFKFLKLSYNCRIMFVIVKHGGKQYWAEPGAILALEKIEGEIGDSIKLDVVASSKEDKLNLAAQSVSATITKHYRDDKVLIFKKKKRHHYERKKGHRQHVTQVKIEG